jgi:DNA-directed RNA polymerase subunit RPC12/RpoP
MEFRVGQVTARCPSCEATVFDEGRNGQSFQSKYRCARCETEVTYSELIVQIGKLSAARSRLRLASVRAQGARSPDAVVATVTHPAAAFLLRATRTDTSRG